MQITRVREDAMKKGNLIGCGPKQKIFKILRIYSSNEVLQDAVCKSSSLSHAHGVHNKLKLSPSYFWAALCKVDNRYIGRSNIIT